MTTSLRIDFETRSTVDLRKTGVYPYAEHPDTDIWCLAWAFDTEEPAIWTPSAPMHLCTRYGLEAPLPCRIVEHIKDGGEVRAWNAQFERILWREVMVKRYGAPSIANEQFVCSAAEAAAMALPRALGQAAEVLGVEQQKDDAGHRLMLQMSRPREILEDGTIIWWDEDGCRTLAKVNGWTDAKLTKELSAVRTKIGKLTTYCAQDVRTECAIVNCLRRLTPKEREIYLLDQRINDRGVQIDRPLILAAQHVADTGIERANLVMREITGGAVTSVMKHADLTNWLREKGIQAAGVSKAAVREMLEGELTAQVREALETKADAGRTSIAKLRSLLEAASSDDRVRGMLLYHGAGTGRWAGRGPQPHNFPRGEVEDIESFIPATMAMQYDVMDLFHHPIVIVSSMLRSMLTAGPGHELIAPDYSAIEARVLNWVADQQDVLQMFREGKDVYKYNAMRLYKIPLEEVKKFPHRQTGKFQELGCGFQMGAKKAVTAAKDVYGLTITQEEADAIVKNYRETHDKVVKLWKESENAVKEAVSNPGRVVTFGGIKNLRALKHGGYLMIVLPSGRALHYAAPRLKDSIAPWATPEEIEGGSPPMVCQVTFSGINSFTRQWQRMALYGGLIVENIVQAIARDLMAEGMLRAEAKGYLPILSVHDEVVAEVPVGFGSVEELEQILCELPAWAAGCPVAAEGWRGFRYRK